MSVQTYSPSMVVLTFGGYTAQGWDSITIDRDLPSFRQINGIRGKNTRVRVSNTSATITLRVPHTSQLNSIFNEIVRLDEQYGTARINLMIKDLLGTEIFKTEDAYIERPASVSFDSDVGDREWILRCMTSESARGEGWGVMSLINSIF